MAANHLQVRTDVETQTHERIRLRLKTRRQHPRKLLGHLPHVGKQEHFLVREMVIDGRAPNARTLSNLAHGDRLESLLGHQRPERLKQARASQLAVRGEGLANNLRHRPILTLCPYVSSNGRACRRQRAQRATTASTIGRSATIHGSAERSARGTHLASRCDAPARGSCEFGATSASHTPITRPPRIGHH